MPHAHRRPFADIAGREGAITGRHREAHRHAALLENGHTVPSLETLEKFARALEVPLYRFFYEGKKSPILPPALKRKAADETGWGETRQEVRDWERFHYLLARMKESDRRLLLVLALKMAGR
jgi:transcriptional regulator with XRE-family HTH domain